MNTNPLFTNVVLVIIAALLLVLVIQNGMQQGTARPPLTQITYSEAAPSMPERNPSVNPSAQNMAHNMFFMAIKAFPEGCKGLKVLDECNSPAAQQIKSQIESVASSGKGPRQVFDFVVETWGEKVLTDQALQIRNMRVKGK